MANPSNKKTAPKRNAASTTNPLSVWWNQQASAIKFSMERLWFNPVSTWITLAAIAIALSLPTSLHLLLKNMQTLTADKREVPTITLFLKQSVAEQQAKDRAELLSEMPEIDNVRVVTREEALADFRKITGFAQTLETLDENPLPHVLILTPRLSLLGDLEMDVEGLSKKLKAFPEVDDVQIDVEWVQRLRGILRIAERIVLVVSILLGLTVLLVVGNTIRLDIENRKEEIRVTQLIGATNAYIRRPFIYNGIWLGLFGGVLSLVIVHVALLFLVEPVTKLANLYGSTFILSGIDVFMTLKILLASSLLGIIGSWLAVGRYLWQSDDAIKD
ncbi:MAG: permease-like cell division protein FtsX [Candidatus Thiothrix putei]|jgi:Cell division protein|uniref:Cell division protein FtsX n=2 Tax=Thiothrix TaxID=1030 RepID=A0A1H4BFA0_9GAMM|nr:permease-like cell division protein FtsX [Thiothrix caldifontis]WGZ95356.1 MAG: permease-like cell division protein FtsX [Candidatus Thiothrix putei]SEA46482.1 cell division transport system permease protein [Thiothrix caldifontis]